jgi:predicted nuclease of predicted toxin-antitoxin system
VRILLDESLPRPLTRLLPEHDVRTVGAMGWAGKRNGELLRLASAEFDALLTADQNLEHQQNLEALPMAVVVLVAPTNRIQSLRPLIPGLLATLQTLAPGRLVRVGV